MVLWGAVFSGKESVNKIASVFNESLLSFHDVPGIMLGRVSNMTDKVPTHMEFTF